MRCRGGNPLILLLVVSLCAARANGDEPPPAAPSSPSATAKKPADAEPASGTPVVEIKPELFYLRDKDGRLVPVPGFTYDDFVKYYRLKEQIEKPAVKPRFSLEQLTVGATTESDHAELTVAAKILLIDAEWTRIPLRLNKCALSETVGYKGNGDQFLQFDPSGDGYVCWLRGPARSEHELVLKLVAPLARTAGESRLELALPRAAASKLTWQVASADVNATASAGSSSPDITREGRGSLISVLGIGGDCWVAWRAADQPPIRLSSALEAVGQVFVKIDGRSVSSEATLTVRSFGAEFDHFRVRLPPGAQLTGGAEPGYTLSPVGSPDAGLVDVKLDRKTVGPVDVRLLTERAYDVTKRGESLELAGFSIVEAIAHRQWGHIAVAVSGDWQLIWGEPSRARQVDELPEPLRRRDLTAGFEYFGQPAVLPARVVPRKTRLSVDPQYNYRVGAAQTELEARLKYTIRGSRVFKFDLDLPGWEIDSISPEERIDANSIVSTMTGSLTVPLLQPATGEFELVIKAHRPNQLNKNVIEWMLPEPRADVHGPADIFIIPAENVDLSPLVDKLIGLNPGTASALPADAPTTTLSYRAEQNRARFRAEMTVHQQAISADCDAQILIRPRVTEVVQRFDYRIRYEPLDRITLDVPLALLDDPTLQFTVSGETAEPHEVGEPPSADRRTIELPIKPTTGVVRVEVHFRKAQAIPTNAASQGIDIPLIAPLGARISKNEATIEGEPGIRIEQREGPWSVLDSAHSSGAAHAPLRFTTSDPAPEIRVAVGLEPQHGSRATVVDRAWIQSWVAESVRQDRVVYSFSSDDERIHLSLPEGISSDEVEVILDGHTIVLIARAPNSLDIPLPSDPNRHNHLLELRYQFHSTMSTNGQLSFGIPLFDRAVQVQRTYWQLVLPADVMLVTTGANLNPEFAWEWTRGGLGFERVPFKEQRQLEQWIGLTNGNAKGAGSTATIRGGENDLPQRTNRYLFSTVGAIPEFEVAVARRWLVVLLASFATLLAAIALLYVPALRQTRVLAAGGCGLVLLALAWPDQSILTAEAAVLGLALAVLAVVLRRALRDSAQQPIIRFEGSTLDHSSRQVRPPVDDDDLLVTSTASMAAGIEEEKSERRDDRRSDSKRRIGGSSSGAGTEL